MTGLAERLREKAREYELNKLAAEDRHDPAAPQFATVAVTLYEVANALEDDE
jgi:hypothetical protein